MCISVRVVLVISLFLFLLLLFDVNVNDVVYILSKSRFICFRAGCHHHKRPQGGAPRSGIGGTSRRSVIGTDSTAASVIDGEWYICVW